MTRRWLAALAFLPFGAACSVASVDVSPSAIAQNVCKTDAECGGGLCAGQRCIGTSAQLRTFLFQVTPSTDASLVAGVQLQTVKDLGGTLNVKLQPMVDVVGGITSGRLTSCTPSFVDAQGAPLAPALDSSIPAQVTLTPSEQVLGVYSAPIVTKTIWDATKKAHSFAVSVPPGDYDIYVEPGAQAADSTCVLPPELVRKVTINVSALTIDTPVPSTFTLDVTWPAQTDTLDTLKDWYADMLDPVSGRVISNRAPLVPSGMPGPTTTDYVANLVYAPVAGGASSMSGQELIRLQLRPPSCVLAETPAGSCQGVATPTLLMVRSALSLFSPSSGTLTQFTHIPSTVHVEGQVTQLGLSAYARAHVTLIAKQLAGIDPGLFAAFTRTVDTDTDGSFAVDLLPGKYAVYAVPSGEFGVGAQCGASDATHCLAQASQLWDVATTPASQGGRVIELSSAIPVVGAVADFSGHAVVGAQVQTLASPAPLASDVLSDVLGSASSIFVPRASADVVQPSGGFKIWSDPGIFDLSVRPQAGTGFAWLVRPSLSVPSTAYASGLNLGVLPLPLPIPYSGTVVIPGASGSGALIRAYVYMQSTQAGSSYTASYTDDPKSAQAVLQVAETRADTSGHFELLIPAKLNQAGP